MLLIFHNHTTSSFIQELKLLPWFLSKISWLLMIGNSCLKPSHAAVMFVLVVSTQPPNHVTKALKSWHSFECAFTNMYWRHVTYIFCYSCFINHKIREKQVKKTHPNLLNKSFHPHSFTLPPIHCPLPGHFTAKCHCNELSYYLLSSGQIFVINFVPTALVTLSFLTSLCLLQHLLEFYFQLFFC